MPKAVQPTLDPSLTPETIRKGFAALRPGADYDSWRMLHVAAAGQIGW